MKREKKNRGWGGRDTGDLTDAFCFVQVEGRGQWVASGKDDLWG